MKLIHVLSTILALLHFVAMRTATAQIIHVPQDFGAIQQAIEEATTGDTILVAPGRYVGNLDFMGKNLVVGSMFLTTGDTSYISNTILDANGAGTVVTFRLGEDTTAVLCGFKVTNGATGGIFCKGASPKLMHLIVTDNKLPYYSYSIR